MVGLCKGKSHLEMDDLGVPLFNTISGDLHMLVEIKM